MSGANKDADGEFDWSDFATFASVMAAMSSGISIAGVANACPSFQRKLQETHPIKAAATFAGLLTEKRLQKNCLRLELLVHLSVGAAQGSRGVTAETLIQGYTAVGAECGFMEDPPEDVFTGGIHSARGNYRILEGTWESATFYLQRIVNIVDQLPGAPQLQQLADSVHALLRLADIVCEKSGLSRNELGNTQGLDRLSPKMASRGGELRRRVQFGIAELARLGIEISALRPFVFDATHRTDVLDQSIGESDLERRPIGIDGDRLYLLLPTAVSIAIRHLVIETLGQGSNRELLIRHLGSEYEATFRNSPGFGTHAAIAPFARHEHSSISSSTFEVDSGRYVVLVCFLDTLEDFVGSSFAGARMGSEEFEEEIDQAISSAREMTSKIPGFREGMVLLVGCGVGRGVALKSQLNDKEGWTQDFLSAPDFCTLNQVNGFEALDLWRIASMQHRLSQMGMRLQNVNGLLNLYGWAEYLDGHLVPHASIPEDATNGESFQLLIQQNSILDVRHRTQNAVDRHVQMYVDGSWLEVWRDGEPLFQEDNEHPIYTHLQKSGPLGAVLTSERCWWYQAVAASGRYDLMTHERWKMMGTWMSLSAKVLERAFRLRLGDGPILWRCVFESSSTLGQLDEFGTEEEATQAISVSIGSQRDITLRIAEGFERALYHPKNIAERALVAAFVSGVAQLTDNKAADIQSVVAEILPNADGRFAHRFHARTFRDHVAGFIRKDVVTISRFDNAAARLGLGWLARRREDGGRIEGKAECRSFLNSLVSQLEQDLCRHLREFNRRKLLQAILRNYEAAAISRERWKRTAAAVLGLRRDKLAVREVMHREELKLNAVFQSSRILIEMVICECPIECGFDPGELDLSRLMTKTSELFHLGGWSDLIHWDMLDPLLVVRPLGDVHADQDYVESVMAGFTGATSDIAISSAVKRYAKNLDPPEIRATLEKDPDGFAEAWKQELGADFDSYRRFVDAVENLGIEREAPIVEIRRSELLALADTPDVGAAILNALSFTPRNSWREVPAGYAYKDIAPARFRRRLSCLRRPLLMESQGDDPSFLVTPGLLREALSYLAGNYYNASFPDWQLGSAMKKFAGRMRDKTGTEFNKIVAAEMSRLGWEVDPEVKLTKILRKALERDYGDVDVLAYDRRRGRVLVMECKDLQYRKTYGEIAEQLADFRGDVVDGKRDLLRKHLDRVELLRENASTVAQYLGMNAPVGIESHLVFRNPVPMQFSKGPVRDKASLHTFNTLGLLG